MPMYGRALGQMVPDVDAHAITLPEVQSGPGDLAVERIGVNGDARQDRPAYDGGLQFENFDAVLRMRSQLTISVDVKAVSLHDVAWGHGGHVNHGFSGRVPVHDHSGRHDGTMGRSVRA